MNGKLEPILKLAPVIPVLTIERAADAGPLAKALYAGGLKVLEITLRTAAGLEAVKYAKDAAPDAVVGVGTVLTQTDLEKAAGVGAAFAVSPGMTQSLFRGASQNGAPPLLPGIGTASELMACIELGFKMFKLFPAVPAGGVGALRALAGPFPGAKFCPTGGIDLTNAQSFLNCTNVLCVGGSWVAPKKAIEEGAWDAIEKLAREATTGLKRTF